MKTLILIMLTVFVLSACGVEETTPQSYTFTHEDTVFHGFRTRYHGDVLENPAVKTFNAKEALGDYLDDHQGYVGDDTFAAYADTLSESFFETHQLIVIRVEENSGSITHNLNALEVEGDVLNIEINRIVPDGGMTMDMAGWYLVLEMPHDYNDYSEVKVHVNG